MGHISNIKIHSNVSDKTAINSIEMQGNVSPSEIEQILASIRERDCMPGPSEDAGEVVQVPRSNLEGEAEPTEDIDWRARWTNLQVAYEGQLRHWDIQESALSARTGHLDAARGAARMMADALTIENSSASHVAKLIKQCLSHVEARRDEFNSMTDEMANMARALERFGFDPPHPTEGEPVHRYCQRLAHHLDELKRKGWRLLEIQQSDSVSEGRAVVHLSDAQRMEKVAALQKEMGELMEDAAMAGGFINEGMDRGEYVGGLKKWAVDVDKKRAVDEELARMAKESPPESEAQPAPQSDAEKLAARTKPVDTKVRVKVDLESEEEATARRAILGRIEADRASAMRDPTSAG